MLDGGTGARIVVVLALTFSFAAAPMGCSPLRTGLESLQEKQFAPLRGRRVALVTNHTAVDARLRHVADLLASSDATLVALFAPEHGVRGAAQAGEHVENARDPMTGAPVYSLYGAARKPTSEQLRGVDVIVYDMQDIGVRTYTYLSTLRASLEAAAGHDLDVWVLDRPNPLGGIALDGPVLDPRFESFVGPHPMPLRYGLTTGEYARMVNEQRDIGARLHVVALQGWRREMTALDSRAPWVAPSPNIPTPQIALIYSGFVLVEGTNLSEGRGTTRPFQLVGAPWIDGVTLRDRLEARRLAGVLFRPASFTPTFSKHAGETCGGVEAHVIDAAAFRPVATAVALIIEVRRLAPERFQFRDAAFDRLAGTDELRKAIERGDTLEEIAASWQPALERFRQERRRFLMY